MRPSIFIGFIFVVCLAPAFAQRGTGFIIKEYNTENGLPANGIKGIAYDRKTNFLWVGTEAGIIRFNGQDFKTFTTRHIPQLSSERIAKLTKGVAGNILIFDTENNIFTIDNNQPVLLRKKDSLTYINHNRVLSIELSNKLLIEKVELGNSNNNYNTLNEIIALDDTACIVSTNDKRILVFFDKKSSPDTINLDANFVKSFFKIADQPFFADRDGKIFSIDIVNKTVNEITLKTTSVILNAEQVKTSIITWNNSEQHTLFFRNKDAYVLSFDGRNIVAKLICNTIPTTSNIRYALYQPDTKQIFIGTESKGIIIIKPNYFQSIKNTENNPLIPNATYSQIPIGHQQILLNDVVVLGKGDGKPPNLPIKEKFGLSTYLLNDSILIYSKVYALKYNHAVHVYNYYTGKTTAYPKTRINSTFGAALSNHNIYISTRMGFGILKGDSMEIIIKPPLVAMEGISAMDMEEVNPGIFLTASCSGLIQFNANTKNADTLLAFPGNCFRNIQKIGDYFFIGTYGAGFYIYKNGVIKKMPLDKEKHLLYAHCFIPDNNGFCWISTNRGLFKAKIADMIRRFNEENSAIYYHYFGKNDGIAMTELNGGCTPCAIQLQDGTLSFPSMDGLLWVHPDTIPDILPGSNVFIDEMITDDTTFTQHFENMVLPATTNSITIKLSYNGWGNKENIYFDYRLGKDALYKPVKIEDGAIIQFDNLPAGKYEITIRKLNGFGVDNYSYKTIHFTIEKYWFDSWWFTLLCFIAALGIIRMYLRYKTQKLEADRLRLEKQVAEKTQTLHQKNAALEKSNSLQTRLISIISHDIITPLKFMAVGGKELMEKHAIMSESLKQETIEEITHTAQELQLLSTNIMNWMKYQNENRIQVKETFNLYDICTQVTGILKSIAKQKNIPILNKIPTDLNVFQYYEPLKILVYNLLSNAINFSNTGEITIGAITVGDHIRLTVEDKGAGMTQEQIKNILSDEFIISSANIDNRKGNGLGYLIIKDLLKMLDGKLDIESKKGSGTLVSVTFPGNVNRNVS